MLFLFLFRFVVVFRGVATVKVSLKLLPDVSYPPGTVLTFTCGKTRKVLTGGPILKDIFSYERVVKNKFLI